MINMINLYLANHLNKKKNFVIAEQSFCYTKYLICCKIPLNSQLKIIDQCLFADSRILSISIPTKFEKICQNSFSNCFNLRNVFFTVDSKIQEIENKIFSNSSVILLNFLQISQKLVKIRLLIARIL